MPEAYNIQTGKEQNKTSYGIWLKKFYLSSLYSPRTPLWSSGQVSGYRSRGSGFDSRRYQIFLEVVGLERGPLSLVSTTEELLRRKSSGSSLENREYGRGDPLRWPRDTLYQQKFALTSLTSGGSSIGTVRSRTKATELFVFVCTRRTDVWEQKYNATPQNGC
jgi:hypothetical protein